MDKQVLKLYEQYDRYVSGDVNGQPAWDIIKQLEGMYDVDSLVAHDGTRLWNVIRVFIYSFYQEMTGGRRYLSKHVWLLLSRLMRPQFMEDEILVKVMVQLSRYSSISLKQVKRELQCYLLVFLWVKRFHHLYYRIHRPQRVVLRCGYGRVPMGKAQACRELGIPCVEKQHGVIDRFFVPYVRASPTENHDGVPEYLCTFGDVFTSIVQEGFLFDPGNVVTEGYRFPCRRVLFTSQWIIHEWMYDFIVRVARLLDSHWEVWVLP